ncbi:DUF429 domain-containing protein [Rossellomorea vietnamensis]|uniref:DUF429 domain-containing protein n=1 Tax=Rossellomorea vietnamensis TaxID=218284 RepID=A0A5D4MFX3_9BACI|nr:MULTISPECIES: DUF429 domain-containing protein [Bacillaceae]TYS00398.1 DUF429 domain-containing protein [Rossellomorea vietnamensis]
MIVMGIDLSGPSNPKDTVISIFEKVNGSLKFRQLISGATDEVIISRIKREAENNSVFVGIDSPLSYQDGGGDRQADKRLRAYIKSLGMNTASVMSPTMNRMAYLTLRGIALTRAIGSLETGRPVKIVEVHPGAAMGSRISDELLPHLLQYKRNEDSLKHIFNFLQSTGLNELPEEASSSTHAVDACAAALGAWFWADPYLEPNWCQEAAPPHHPYDFCC